MPQRWRSLRLRLEPTITIGLTDPKKQEIATRDRPQEMEIPEDFELRDVPNRPQAPPAPGHKAYTESIGIPDVAGTAS